MAQRKPRQSAREVAARERVRARRAGHWERERQLEDLATDYEVAAQEIEDVTTAAEEKIAAYVAKLRNDVEDVRRSLRARQAAGVGKMLELDGIRSVADRLGESVEVVRKLTTNPGSTSDEAGADSGSAVDESTSPGAKAGEAEVDRTLPPMTPVRPIPAPSALAGGGSAAV
ncbi:hypothetical protein ACI2L4_10005 [Streptomyces sparsogenes]|uniref:hypothetical protein n=1 Tax=Streptomyces sparsogenes TaxID=67365 RepID=UPI00384B92E9